MALEHKAPNGKTRVVGVDLLEHTDYLIGDYNAREEAFVVADAYNKVRSGDMDDVFYVFDDKGVYIRGNEAVAKKISTG
jgi:hypothetical protein